MATQAYVGEVVTLLNVAATTGASGSVTYPVDQMRQLPIRVVWEVLVGGTAAGLRVDLEASLDDTNWYQLDTYTSTTSTMRWVIDKPAFFLRVNVVTLTAGAAPTVTARLVGLDG